MSPKRRDVITALISLTALPRGARGQTPTLIPPADQELMVAVPGGRIYVRVNGRLDGPKAPLILVHGGPAGTLWQMLPALSLATDRGVILYDQLDGGRSEAPGDPANWTVERFAGEIDAIRGALSLDRVHVLGHSWGGQIATHYAAGVPDGLLSVILQGTPSSARRAEASIASLLGQLPDEMGEVISAHEAAGRFNDPLYQRAAFTFYRRHIGRTDVNELAAAYMQGLPDDRGQALARAMNGPAMTRFGGVLENFDDTPFLRLIENPVLLLTGEFDLITPDAVKETLPLLRNGSSLQIADAGHMIQFDQPDAWRDAISSFIKAHEV